MLRLGLLGIGTVMLAGCSDEAAQITPPVRITYTLVRGEKLVCTDAFFRIGLPSASSPFPEIIAYIKRHFECHLEPAPVPSTWTKTKVIQTWE
jgi:hypothetical protein